MTHDPLDKSVTAALAVFHPDYVDPPPPATMADVVRLLVEILEEIRALHRDVEI